MTDNQIKRLLELQKRFDAGEISKEMFDLGVAAIRGADKSNADSSQADTKPAPPQETQYHYRRYLSRGDAVIIRSFPAATKQGQR